MTPYEEQLALATFAQKVCEIQAATIDRLDAERKALRTENEELQHAFNGAMNLWITEAKQLDATIAELRAEIVVLRNHACA